MMFAGMNMMNPWMNPAAANFNMQQMQQPAT